MTAQARGSVASYCVGKVRMTRREAQAAAKRMTRRYETPMAAYACPACGHYHCGSDRARKPIRTTRLLRQQNEQETWDDDCNPRNTHNTRSHRVCGSADDDVCDDSEYSDVPNHRGRQSLRQR